MLHKIRRKSFVFIFYIILCIGENSIFFMFRWKRIAPTKKLGQMAALNIISVTYSDHLSQPPPELACEIVTLVTSSRRQLWPPLAVNRLSVISRMLWYAGHISLWRLQAGKVQLHFKTWSKIGQLILIVLLFRSCGPWLQ